MKTLVVVALVVLCGYVGWSRFQPPLRDGAETLHASPYVIVYGRDRCGITQRMRSDLQRLGVPFERIRMDGGKARSA